MERPGAIISAASRSRFTTFPTTDRRTPQRRRTSTYLSRIAALIDQVKVSCATHVRRNSALGFVADVSVLKPAMPATRTDVSTTPLRRGCGGLGHNGQARLSRSAAVRANRVGELLLGQAFEIAGTPSGFARPRL